MNPAALPRRLAVFALTLALVPTNGFAAAPARAPASDEELRQRLSAHVEAARFESALWSIKIASLDSGRTWFEHHPGRLMSPASNSKLFVTALALDRLGADYRISTPIRATARPGGDGTLPGNLVVCGRGDPSWKTRAAGRPFSALFDPFVRVLTDAGVRRIRGDIVADATYFRALPHGAGWAVGDLEEYYGAEISAVSLQQNYTQLRVTPAAVPGGPWDVTLMDPHTGLTVENRGTTTPAGESGQLVSHRLFGERKIYLFGERPAGATAERISVAVPRPADWFATALRAELIARGIAVEGNARSVRWPERELTPEPHVTLGEVTSPPLAELLADLMKRSDNLETDLVFAHLGEKFRAANAPAWRTSEQSAVRLLDDFLEQHDLRAAEVRFEEGSGLSRNNLVSANAIVALLTFMARHREAAAFRDTLPVAGVDGTLRARMRTTAAEGNVRAKTGTLRWANNLSGYVTTAGGERVVFSVMLNRAVAPTGESARAHVDAIAVMLAEFAAREPARASGG